MIQPGIAKELTSMMQTWLMNKAACPPAVMQEPDNTLNLLDVDFWLWYQKVTPKGMACALKIKFWETFNIPGYYDILTNGQYKMPNSNDGCMQLRAPTTCPEWNCKILYIFTLDIIYIEVGLTNWMTPYFFLIIMGYHARCLSLFLPTPLYIHAGILLHTSVDYPHRWLRYIILSSFLTVVATIGLK